MQKAVLIADDLSVGYSKPTKRVAEHIALSMHRGQLIALCGANGSGKSTLIRTLCGLQPSLSGTVTVDGNLLSELSAAQRAKLISLVLTDKPSARLTVRELVTIGRQPHTGWLGTIGPSDEEIINRSMRRTGVYELANRICGELSDGQLQLAMIARALAQDTPLIVLDEPTTHLDIPNKFILLDLLRKLAHDENRCVLFSTHDIDPALDFCDEMILMRDARAVQHRVNELNAEVLNDFFADRKVFFDAWQRKFVYRP